MGLRLTLMLESLLTLQLYSTERVLWVIAKKRIVHPMYDGLGSVAENSQKV